MLAKLFAKKKKVTSKLLNWSLFCLCHIRFFYRLTGPQHTTEALLTISLFKKVTLSVWALAMQEVRGWHWLLIYTDRCFNTSFKDKTSAKQEEPMIKCIVSHFNEVLKQSEVGASLMLKQNHFPGTPPPTACSPLPLPRFSLYFPASHLSQSLSGIGWAEVFFHNQMPASKHWRVTACLLWTTQRLTG